MALESKEIIKLFCFNEQKMTEHKLWIGKFKDPRTHTYYQKMRCESCGEKQ